MQTVINGNCVEELPKLIKQYGEDRQIIIVSDPPFNIGYQYRSYKDKMDDEAYFKHLAYIFSQTPSVVIHYPESLYKLTLELKKAPVKVVSWVYNSNTPRQHRDVAFFDVKPDFRKVTQPYKNPNDKRIQKRIKEGKTGCKLYDWWNINQVKNVSKEKVNHPCQMPLKVMTNIIGILPDDALIIDPFVGSGTTGVACKLLNRDFIGIELDSYYCELAKKRIEDATNESVHL